MSYFFTFLLLFPTLIEIPFFFFSGFLQVSSQMLSRMYLSIHGFLELGGGGISGDSMVPMLRPGLLRLSYEGWDKRGRIPPLCLEKVWWNHGLPSRGYGVGIDISS